jgi:phage-related protein
MARIASDGLRSTDARKLRGRIWEVRVEQKDVIHRILFASVGARGRVLLSLEAFVKKTKKTPPARIDLAESRLRDWELRG